MKSHKLPPGGSSKLSQSPFKAHTKNASKDLESYILRTSNDSLKLTNYNFKEVDSIDESYNK